MVPRRAAATKPVGNIPLNRRWLMVGSFSRLTYKYIYIYVYKYKLHTYMYCIYDYVNKFNIYMMILVPSAVEMFHYYVMMTSSPLKS